MSRNNTAYRNIKKHGGKNFRGYNNRQMTDEQYLQREYDKKEPRINKPVFDPKKLSGLRKCTECGGKVHYNTLGGKFCRDCRTWYA